MVHQNKPQPLILAVDDSPLIHRILERRLAGIQVRLSRAENGQDALKMARDENPDVILLDIGLPDMSGFEALSALKNEPLTMHIPVIILTASDSSEDKVLGFELGAVDYVTKPFDTAELQARVRSVLRTQHLVHMLEQKARVDALTGLWNRAYLDHSLRANVKSALRHDNPLSILICDLDHFKIVNDTFGHSIGDTVLEKFAYVLTNIARQEDIICRYGGEEFVIILPMTDLDEAIQAAERHRVATETGRWSSIKEPMIITASFGAASLENLSNKTPQGLIEAADRALYQAKHSGRNCVVAFDPAAPIVESELRKSA